MTKDPPDVGIQTTPGGSFATARFCWTCSARFRGAALGPEDKVAKGSEEEIQVSQQVNCLLKKVVNCMAAGKIVIADVKTQINTSVFPDSGALIYREKCIRTV